MSDLDPQQSFEINPNPIPPSQHVTQIKSLSQEKVLPISHQLLTLPVLLPEELDQLLIDNDYLINAVRACLNALRLEDGYRYYKKLQSNIDILLYHCETYTAGTDNVFTHRMKQDSADGKLTRKTTIHLQNPSILKPKTQRKKKNQKNNDSKTNSKSIDADDKNSSKKTATASPQPLRRSSRRSENPFSSSRIDMKPNDDDSNDVDGDDPQPLTISRHTLEYSLRQIDRARSIVRQYMATHNEMTYHVQATRQRCEAMAGRVAADTTSSTANIAGSTATATTTVPSFGTIESDHFSTTTSRQ